MGLEGVTEGERPTGKGPRSGLAAILAGLLWTGCAGARPATPLLSGASLCTAPEEAVAGTRRLAPAGFSYVVPRGFRLTDLGPRHRLYEQGDRMLGVAVTGHAPGFLTEGHPGLELLGSCTAGIHGREVRLFLGRWGQGRKPVYEIQAEWSEPVPAGHLRVELHTLRAGQLAELRRVLWSVRKPPDPRDPELPRAVPR